MDVNVDELTLKNVVPHSVATALASIVFPVPGGPTINTPRHGRRIPLKKSGLQEKQMLNNIIQCTSSVHNISIILMKNLKNEKKPLYNEENGLY